MGFLLLQSLKKDGDYMFFTILILIILVLIVVYLRYLQNNILRVENKLNKIEDILISSDDGNEKSISSMVNKIKTKVCPDEISISWSHIPKEKNISSEDFQKLKEKILSFLSLQDNWDGRGSLPIDKLSVMTSIRFLQLMDRNNYLSQNNCPEVQETREGGVKFAFKRFEFPEYFQIWFLPEGSEYNYRYECTGHFTNDEGEPNTYERYYGITNNPNEVLKKLIESTIIEDN